MVTLLWLWKMAAACQHFALQGMLEGTTASYMAGIMDTKDPQEDLMPCESECSFLGVDEEEVPLDDVHDEGTLSLVTLCIRIGVSIDDYPSSHCSHSWQKMAIHVTWKISQPPFKNLAFPLPFDNSYSSSVTLIAKLHPPLSPISHNFMAMYMFTAQRLQHSLHQVIFVVSEGCAKSGFAQHILVWASLLWHHICCLGWHPSWHGRYGYCMCPTTFLIQLQLCWSCCTLVNWLVCKGDQPDPDTGMWVVSLEKQDRVPMMQVINVKTIICAAHLIPVFGSENVPSDHIMMWWIYDGHVKAHVQIVV